MISVDDEVAGPEDTVVALMTILPSFIIRRKPKSWSELLEVILQMFLVFCPSSLILCILRTESLEKL